MARRLEAGPVCPPGQRGECASQEEQGRNDDPLRSEAVDQVPRTALDELLPMPEMPALPWGLAPFCP